VVGAAIARLRERFQLLAEGPGLFDRWMEVVLQRELRGKRAHDAWLAAIALLHDVDRILTLNAADFSGIDGIATVHPANVK
jgi:predicted nucleic acid-binding protein